MNQQASEECLRVLSADILMGLIRIDQRLAVDTTVRVYTNEVV